MNLSETLIFKASGIAAAIIVFCCLIWFIKYKKSTNSRNESNNVQLNTLNTNSLSSNRISANPINNTLSSEFVDPLPLYTLPATSTHEQVHNSVQAQMPAPPQEILDRPPTYKL